MKNKELESFIERAGFEYGWENLEFWARRMAEQAVEEISELRAALATQHAAGVPTLQSLARSICHREDISERGNDQFLQDFLSGKEEITIMADDLRAALATPQAPTQAAGVPEELKDALISALACFQYYEPNERAKAALLAGFIDATPPAPDAGKAKLPQNVIDAVNKASADGKSAVELPDGGVAFINRGEDLHDTGELDCPACGGSGHIDDYKQRHPEQTTHAPIARVTGYFGGRCCIEPIDKSRVFNVGTALFGAAAVQAPDAGKDAPATVEAGEDGKVVDDLAMMVRRLVNSMQKHKYDSVLCEKAMDYLARHDLQGSPLREATPPTAAPAGDARDAARWREALNHIAIYSGWWQIQIRAMGYIGEPVSRFPELFAADIDAAMREKGNNHE